MGICLSKFLIKGYLVGNRLFCPWRVWLSGRWHPALFSTGILAQPLQPWGCRGSSTGGYDRRWSGLLHDTIAVSTGKNICYQILYFSKMFSIFHFLLLNSWKKISLARYPCYVGSFESLRKHWSWETYSASYFVTIPASSKQSWRILRHFKMCSNWMKWCCVLATSASSAIARCNH